MTIVDGTPALTQAADIDWHVCDRAAAAPSGGYQTSRSWGPVSAAELDTLALIYRTTPCDHVEAAIEGFRLGWECGRSGRSDIPLTNRPYDRSAIDVDWCEAHGVAEDAFDFVLSICASSPDPGEAVTDAFRIAYRAALDPTV